MAPIHTESRFESEICADLAAGGWRYTPPTDDVLSPDAKLYDKAHALFPADLQAWLEASQPDTWAAIVKAHGANALPDVMKRLRLALDAHGTLHTLRQGFEMLGLAKPISVVQFRPALAMNPDLQARYAANILRVVRQVRYSLNNGNEIDLVLFLNGLPMSTVELKSDYTQSVADAEAQYKEDRLPKSPGNNAIEPLLCFPGGALVHFAVSNSEVRTTTRLDGLATRFLPFNQGNAGGAGNPPNPNGFATDYLWKQVWQRASWLDILGRYLAPVKNKHDKKLTSVLFPRYHQLDATREIQAAVLRDGPGDKYLVQHSAGSGKTHSIAWTAHFLADLHDANHTKVFDSVIVVSDRTVLDDQLQEAIFVHERTTGVVAWIQGDGGSKSQELSEALAGNKKIVVCTLQTFPYALDKIRALAATEGKRFAVIADEAHSSQTNETAAAFKKVLLSERLALNVADDDDEDAEDLVNRVVAAQMNAKAAGKESGITFVAFTATPKEKTLQLFGTRPDTSRPPADDNLPAPFHVYSMRQAIEEGFILDVLQNHTSYQVAFELAHGGEAQFVDESAATAGIFGWLALNKHNIAQRVALVVEHFHRHVEPLMHAQAKAMVVTASRLEAVRWQVALQQYIQDKGYPYSTLVAFSGEVVDPDTRLDLMAETSKTLNPLLGGQGIREAFSGRAGQRGEFALLVVANKFQTGFDEPLLCGMYVNKRLDGVQAVQTLSRLNRAAPGKDTTYVVDFVNDPEAILLAFQPYYETAELSKVTDPNVIYELRAKLDGLGYYTDEDVNAVAHAVVEGDKQAKVDAALIPVAQGLLKRFNAAKATYREDTGGLFAEGAKAEMDALLQFRQEIGSYSKLYGFLCQVFNYGNTDIEKRHLFYRLLHRLLTFDREVDTVDLSALELAHYTIRELGAQQLALSGGEPIPAAGAADSHPREKQKDSLDAIIQRVNALFVGEFAPNDQWSFATQLKGALLEDPMLAQQARSNTQEQFAGSPDLGRLLLFAVMAALPAFPEMGRQAVASESGQLRADLLSILIGPMGLYEALRRKEVPLG